MTYPVEPTPTTPLPAPPDPSDRSTFNTLAYPWSLAQEQLREELDTLAERTFQNAEAAEGYAAQAQSGLSNYKGAWSGATTYLAGESVQYAGRYWFSTQGGNFNHTPSASAWWYELGVGEARTPVIPLAANHTLVTGYVGYLIACSAALTLTAELPAVLGAGWGLIVAADGGDVSVSVPFADGSSSKTVIKSSSAVLHCDGTVFRLLFLRQLENPIRVDVTHHNLVLPAAASLGGMPTVVDMDATYEVHCFPGNTNVIAAPYNKVTGQFGAPVVVRSATVGAYLSAAKCDTGKLVVATATPSSTTLHVVVLSLTAGALSVGSADTKTLLGNPTLGAMSEAIAIGNSVIIGGSHDGPASWVAAVSVSGTTPSIGTVKALTSYGSPPALWDMSGTLLAISYVTSSNMYLDAASVAGNALTWGTQHSVTSGANQSRGMSVKLASGRLAMVHYSSSTKYVGTVVSLSGTAVSSSSVDLSGVETDAVLWWRQIGNQVLVGGADMPVNVLTDNAGTAVAGTAVTHITYSASMLGITPTGMVLGNASGCAYYTISGNNPVLAKHIAYNDQTGAPSSAGQQRKAAVTQALLQGAEWAITLINDAEVNTVATNGQTVRRVPALPCVAYANLYRPPGRNDVLWWPAEVSSTYMSLTRMEIK